MTEQWKSGTRVKCANYPFAMEVVGRDDVGSVICEWSRGEQLVRGYFTLISLVLAEPSETTGDVHG